MREALTRAAPGTASRRLSNASCSAVDSRAIAICAMIARVGRIAARLAIEFAIAHVVEPAGASIPRSSKRCAPRRDKTNIECIDEMADDVPRRLLEIARARRETTIALEGRAARSALFRAVVRSRDCSMPARGNCSSSCAPRRRGWHRRRNERGPLLRLAPSSARLSSSTFTRGSPKKPNVLPRTCCVHERVDCRKAHVARRCDARRLPVRGFGDDVGIDAAAARGHEIDRRLARSRRGFAFSRSAIVVFVAVDQFLRGWAQVRAAG